MTAVRPVIGVTALAGHALGAEAGHHLIGAFVGDPLAEQIALDLVAAEVAHPGEIVGGLDAFGGDRHPEALGELDDRLDDRHRLRLFAASRTKLPSIFNLWNTALFR